MKPVLPYLILSLTITLSAQSGSWTYFPPAPQVSCLTAAGNTILAGTDGAGIVRYDTLGNRSYYHTGNSTIPTDTLQQITIDAVGHWWIQHPGGISAYDAATWQTWSNVQIGLPENALLRTMKAAPDSSLYVATDNGVAIYKNAAWVVLNTSNSGLPSDNVWDIAFSPDGKVYFATSGTGVVIQDGSNWTSYTTANTGVATMTNVYAVTYTSEGVLWAIGGINPAALVRLVKLDGGTWTGFLPSDLNITGGTFFKKMNVSDDGNLWLITTSTVSVLADEVWTHYYQNTDIGCGSAGNSSPAIAGDGQIWIQNSCQLAVFDGQDWYKPGTGLPGPPLGYFYNGITEDAAGGIWMGTEFGQYASYFQNDVWTQYYPTDLGASYNDLFVIKAAPDGAVWFGLGNAEILKFDNGTWSHFDTCASIFTDHITLGAANAPNGDQWFSFFSTTSQLSTGLAKYSANGTWQFFTPADVPNLQYTYPRNIKFDATGTTWITTSFNGIIKYDGTTWDTITINNSGLPSNRVFDLAFAPDGNLWACTDSGLAVFDGQNWTNITSSNSDLPSDHTYRIAFDTDGGMYIGYTPEVSGTTGATVALLRNGVWSTLTPPGWENTVNEEPDAFMVDSHNRLWFAELTGPGVYLYDPMLVNTKAPDEAAQPIIHVFPNPCPGNCLVQLEAPGQPGMNFRVTNTLGQTVLEVPVGPSDTVTTFPIDVNGLPHGVYWLSLWQEGQLQGRTGFIKI